jgi:hypothetical protein
MIWEIHDQVQSWGIAPSAAGRRSSYKPAPILDELAQKRRRAAAKRMHKCTDDIETGTVRDNLDQTIMSSAPILPAYTEPAFMPSEARRRKRAREVSQLKLQFNTTAATAPSPVKDTTSTTTTAEITDDLEEQGIVLRPIKTKGLAAWLHEKSGDDDDEEVHHSESEDESEISPSSSSEEGWTSSSSSL